MSNAVACLRHGEHSHVACNLWLALLKHDASFGGAGSLPRKVQSYFRGIAQIVKAWIKSE